ncbi:MAG: alpha/beta hydrolase [Kofleriaceae bacterium]|nr:alpha/beta hydrolase [Kofleriaceae bacterium]
MAAPLHVVSAGNGPTLLFIHGSAADHATWAITFASSLRERFSLLAYDRRGCGQSPAADRLWTVEDHADDVLTIIDRQGGPPPILVGSSFGSVVALDVARRFPAALAGLVLIEPPMAASDDVPPIPDGFLQHFDALAVAEGGPAAAEYFLRTVLGDTAYEKMPRMFQARSKAQFAGIRADSEALGCYHPRYTLLRSCKVPTLLLGGQQSAGYFRPTLEKLASVLPAAQLVIVANAGHMLHAQASRKFAELVAAFAAVAFGNP